MRAAMILTLALCFGCKDGDDGADDTGSVGVDGDGDGFGVATDCDDSDPLINPDAAEVCDGVDNDCDDKIDAADDSWDASTGFDVFRDSDGDGFGTGAATQACQAVNGTSEVDGDCDDEDPAQFPGADELCNGEDDSCDGLVDVGAVDASTFYTDGDGDGYGDVTVPVQACAIESGLVSDATDCDDGDGAQFPGADEYCNLEDDDCDGQVDEDALDETRWYVDLDGDGYGNSGTSVLACDPPSNFVADDSDCNDADEDINPAASETCDGVDSDCNASTTDDNTVAWTASDGTVTDLTADLSGTSSSPATHTFSSDGSLLFCDGTFYVNLDIQADVAISSDRGDSRFTILDGASTDSVIDIEGSGLSVSVSDVTIQNGYAYSDYKYLGGSYAGGGGIGCYDTSWTSQLDIQGSSIADNSGTMGGNLVLEGCDTVIADSEITGGTGTYGGAGFLNDAQFEITDTLIQDNLASSDAGAFYLYTYGNTRSSSLALIDSLVDSNTSSNSGGGLYVYYSDLECSSSGGAHGFTNNSTGYYGEALYGTGSTLVSESCDFGTELGGDDNSSSYDYGDLYWGSYYGVGDDSSFTCDSSGCGDTADYSLGGTANDLTSAYLYGDYILADVDATLHGFESTISAGSDCTVYGLVLSSPTGSSGTWSVDWESEISVSTSSAVVDSGEIDLFLESGIYYGIGTYAVCTSSGTIGKTYDFSGGTDAGVGTGIGYIYSSGSPTPGSSSTYAYTSASGSIFEMDLDVTIWD